MSKKVKKTCKALNYFQNFLLFISGVRGYVSILYMLHIMYKYDWYKLKIVRKKWYRKIVDSDGKLQLNGRRIKEALYHKYLWVTTVKYISVYRKQRYKLLD